MMKEGPSNFTAKSSVKEDASDDVLIDDGSHQMISEKRTSPRDDRGNRQHNTVPTIEHSDSLGSLMLCDMDEATTSADISQHHDKASTVRQKRLELLAKLAATTQPKLGRMVSKEVDLATEEEKKSSTDEWFERKFGHIAAKTPEPTTELSMLEEQVMKGEITGVSARQKLQKTIVKSLVEKRREQQEKRWQIYKADNFIEDQQQEEEEEILSDPESELSSDDGEEDEEEEEEVRRLEEERKESKPKCAFLDDEAEESDEGDVSNFDEKEEEKERSSNQPKDGKSGNAQDEPLEDVGKKGSDEQSMSVQEAEDDVLDLVLPNSLSQWVHGGNDYTQSSCGAGYDTTQMSNKVETQDVLALCSGTFGPSTLSKITSKPCNNDKATVVEDTFDSVNMSDVLGLCSARFIDSQVVTPPHSDTARLVSLITPLTSDDDIEFVTAKRRSRKIVLSESEDEEDSHGEDHRGKSGLVGTAYKADEEDDLENADVTPRQNEESDDALSTSVAEEDENAMSADHRIFEGDMVEEEAKGDANEEEEQEEEEEELNSSDDELGIYKRLQQKVSTGSNTDGKRRTQRSEFFDEEASLSGDDVGSDPDEDDEELDEYEAEEGDQDDLPDEETLRLQLHKQWLKQQQDEEDKKLMYWKDQLLEDGDLHMETDRTFRFKLRRETEVTLFGEDEEDNKEGTVKEDENDGEDEEVQKKRIDMIRWKIENKLLDDSLGVFVESAEENSPLMMAGLSAIQRHNSSASNLSQHSGSDWSRNSLLRHRTSLSVVIDQMTNFSGTSNSSKGLFVNSSSKENGTAKRRSQIESVKVKRNKTSVFNALN
uniref:Claspin n=1 Tax=Ascaris lumbricoides TaxID=6252 RepID=A0A9J2PZH7_ASCLU